jgi:hypothetical protein
MDFPTNSHKAKDAEGEQPEAKKTEKVVTGDVVRRKKPFGKRFTETFVGGDAKSVWGYVVFDVLVPAAKDMASDAVSQGIDRMLFGENRPRNRRTGHRPGTNPNGYVSYNRFSQNRPTREDPRNVSRRARASHDFDEIILATRVEAEEVIDRLFDLVSKYEVATVGDLYDLVGITSNYTDSKWGWEDIRGAGVTKVRNGYLLDLPRPEPIE